MTFDASEKSRYGAKPLECYQFKQGTTFYRSTSADRKVILPVGIFPPATISRGELEFSEEDTGEQIEVYVPRDNAVAALFVGDLSSAKVSAQIFRAHRSEEGLAIAWFTGTVKRCRWEESAVLVCSSLASTLNRQFPTVRIQTPCNNVLYSSSCKATLQFDLVTVTTVTGATIVSNDFTARSDQWFRGGRLVNLAGTERRFIVDHQGDTVTLISPMPGLQSGHQVHAVWGCSHLEIECGPAKHNNLDNNLGWERIPTRNPFDGRID